MRRLLPALVSWAPYFADLAIIAIALMFTPNRILRADKPVLGALIFLCALRVAIFFSQAFSGWKSRVSNKTGPRIRFESALLATYLMAAIAFAAFSFITGSDIGAK